MHTRMDPLAIHSWWTILRATQHCEHTKNLKFYCNVVHITYGKKLHPAYLHTARHVHSLYIVWTFQHFEWDEPLMCCLYRQFLWATPCLKNENKLCLWVWNFNWCVILFLGENNNILIRDIDDRDTMYLHSREPISSQTLEEFYLSIIKGPYLKLNYSWSAKKENVSQIHVFVHVEGQIGPLRSLRATLEYGESVVTMDNGT